MKGKVSVFNRNFFNTRAKSAFAEVLCTSLIEVRPFLESLIFGINGCSTTRTLVRGPKGCCKVWQFLSPKGTKLHKDHLSEKRIFVGDNFVDENAWVKSLRLQSRFLGCLSVNIIFYEFDIPQRIKFLEWYQPP